jgi:hypothetical protein
MPSRFSLKHIIIRKILSCFGLTELFHRCISFALSHFEAISLRQSKTTPKRHHVMSLTTTQLIFIIADIAIKVFKRQIKVYGQ